MLDLNPNPTGITPIHQRRIRVMLAMLCVLLSGILTQTTSAQDEPEPRAITTAKQATVFLMQTYDVAGAQALSCIGSGTLISANGLILTNAHLAQAEGPCRGERVVVALSTRLGEPPVPTYVARPVQVDERLDLAVLQITGGLDGSVIAPEVLNLPFVQIGNPLNILPGNTLTYIGYPDLEATSVTDVSGAVIGITAETSGSRLAWLRIGAELGGAMSGGGAYDANGLLVGIPTSAPSSDGSTPSETCLTIQDNSQDGLITDQDACAPIGDAVTQVRPINYAMPLIDSARNGFVLTERPGIFTTTLVDQPGFARLFFSTSVNELGEPTQIVSSAPSGTTSLFLFFDYRNMRPGTPYELKVTRDGLEERQLGLGTLAWGGGPQGKWYIGTEGVTWPDANYEFTLLINGQAVAAQSITVGGAPSDPVIRNVQFGIPDTDGGFVRSGTLFAAENTTQILARFEYANIPTGQQWTEVWSLDGAEVSRNVRTWEAETAGQFSVSATNGQGLPLGTYRLEIFVGDRLAATGDVTLAGKLDPVLYAAPRIFSPPIMAEGITRDGLPNGQTGSALPFGVTSIYAFLNWDLMPNGLLWMYRWYLDGRIIASGTQRWDSGGVGENYWIRLSSSKPLPEGSYDIEIVVLDQPLFHQSVSIGSGTQPITGAQGESSDLFVSGTVADAVTGQGIAGALVFVLDVKYVSAQFLWDESQIHTQTITDQNGRFSLPRGLPKGEFYTVYVMADGYITIVEDNFTVLSRQESPVDLLIEMSRP